MNGAPPPAGAEAPDFEWDERGAPVRLAARCRDSGALLLFLPLACSPVCREDARALAGAAAALGAPRRPLVVVSVDRDAHLRRFLDEHGGALLSPLGDPGLELAGRYGVRRPEGFCARASFLVGRDRRVTAWEVHPIGFPRPIALLQEWIARADG